jgi:hypothetical protein
MRNSIDLVEKALGVLHALGDGAVTLTDIAARTGLLKSSAFRILYTLRELGCVEKPAGNGTYRVTCKVLELSRAAPGRPLLLTLARPYLNRLQDVLQESIWLAELRGRAMILIDVNIDGWVGYDRVKAHSSGSSISREVSHDTPKDAPSHYCCGRATRVHSLLRATPGADTVWDAGRQHH